MNARAPRRERGIGLLEILIAVVVISVGFLAAARMQVEGMRFSQGAYFQSQAHFLANDMVERMRSNPTGMKLGAYDALDTRDAVVSPNCATTDCTPAEQARQDAFDWRAYLDPATAGSNVVLPGSASESPSGTVTALGAGRYRVRLTWFEIIAGEQSEQSLNVFFVPEST